MINDDSFIKFLKLLKKGESLTQDDVKVIQELSATDSRITSLFTAYVKFRNKEITPANYQMIYNSMASKYQHMLDDKPASANTSLDYSSIDINRDKDIFIKYLTYITDLKAGKNVDKNILAELTSKNAIVKSLEDIKVAEENGFVEKGTFRKNYNEFLAALGNLTRNSETSRPAAPAPVAKTESPKDIDFSTIDLGRDKGTFIKYLNIVTEAKIGKEVDKNLLDELKKSNPVIRALEELNAAEERGEVEKGTYRKKYNELLATLGELTRAANARNPGNLIESVKDIKKINAISDDRPAPAPAPSVTNSDSNLGDLKSYIASELGDIKKMLNSGGDYFKLNDLSLKTKELYDYYKLEIKSKKTELTDEEKEKIESLIASNDDIKLVSGAKKMYKDGSISFSSYNNLNEYFFEELKEGLIKDLLPDKDLYFRD